MSDADVTRILGKLGTLEGRFGSLEGKIDVVNTRLDERPCIAHSKKIDKLDERIYEVEKEQIRSMGMKGFIVRLLASSIPMIPIAIMLWTALSKLSGKE